MVGPPHEATHRVFQHDPGLFSRVSRFLGVDMPPPVGAAILPTDLTEASPVERRVDTLLRLETTEQGSFLLAVEAQGKKHPEKQASWAYYVSYLWTKYRLPTALLVVCQDHTTAKWAGQQVSSGPAQVPTLTLRPLVAGPHNMPVITDPEEARADLVLTSLSAITHAAEPAVNGILKALSAGLQNAPEAVADPIIEFTAQGLAEARPRISGGTWWPWTCPSTSRTSPRRSARKDAPRDAPRMSCSSSSSAVSTSPTPYAAASWTATTPRFPPMARTSGDRGRGGGNLRDE